MFSKKTELKLTDFECNLLINGAMSLRFCNEFLLFHRYIIQPMIQFITKKAGENVIFCRPLR